MKTIIIIVSFFGTLAQARSSYVGGHYRSNGAYVQGHHRSSRDNTVNNNYSTYGNTNPYTGQSGTNHVSDSKNTYGN